MPELKSPEGLEVHVSSKGPRIKGPPLALTSMVPALLLACHAGASLAATGAKGTIDITGAEFTNTDPHCSAYLGRYSSSATDEKRKCTFKGTLTITLEKNKCVFASNSIPNHNFNDKSGTFATEVKPVEVRYEVPAEPKVADTPTELSVLWDNAIFLNGVKLDLMAAACYGVGLETQTLGEEKLECFDMDWAWRYDPIYPKNNFKADTHNAHTQPDGAYHYHGNPRAMFKSLFPDKASPVIGFAADGFPIYGPYIEENGVVRRVRSSYSLRVGPRQHQKNQAYFPGGVYDGTFRDDYEYIEGSGDLDKCNGMLRNGQYAYYVTYTYPWVMGCFKGTPDPSFRKKTDDAHAH
jgi:hypothetical protein